MKKKITFFITSFLLINSPNIFSQTKNYGAITFEKAINIAGKQRMLSQKMSKAYLLVAKGINDDGIKKELNSSKFIFEKQIQILTKNASSSAVKLSLKKVTKLWDAFKVVITSPSNAQNSFRIINLNTELLNACNEVVVSIESNANYNNQFFQNKNKELVRTINKSGKQRMLSQRLCLYYTASSMFVRDNEEYKKTIERVFTEFDNTIGDLLISSYNSTEIEEELGSIMSIWEKFQTNKTGLLNGDFELQEIFTTTNDLTKSFNKVTGLYEGIATN